MRTYAFRLPPGADLRAELERLVETQGLRAGCIVTCVGSLSRARLRDDDVREFYLGLHPGADGHEGGERRSFRDVKHYRRKKRWSA